MRNGVAGRKPKKGGQNGWANGNGVAKESGAGQRRRGPQKASPTVDEPSQSLMPPKGKPLNLELPRKGLHASIGLLTIPLYLLWPPTASIRPLIAALVAGVSIILLADLARFRSSSFRASWEKHLGKFMRESEKVNINGTVWYILGVLFCLQVYPRDIAVASILILSWCDTVASFCGRLISASPLLAPYSPALPNPLFGLIPIAPKKSWGGTLACALAGIGIAWGMFGWSWGCIGVGIIAGLAEAVDVSGLDDNLTLPVLSGGLIWSLRILTGSI